MYRGEWTPFQMHSHPRPLFRNYSRPHRPSSSDYHEKKQLKRPDSSNSGAFMHRRWHSLPVNSDLKMLKGFIFSMVTYNLLSNSLLHENMFLYESCDEQDLAWCNRKEKLLAELLSYNAEVSNHHLGD